VKLFKIAFHNLLLTDYPKDKIEWIVVEDTEMAAPNEMATPIKTATPNEMATPNDAMVGESVMSFQVQVPEMKIKYIPIQGRMTIGEKRNLGVENAANDIILFMDDDDHYPETSFRRRVAWLTKGVKRGSVGQANIACCTTLALYDLKRGISAVNVPPYDIPFAQRISEATLTFRKSAWVERKFSNVSLAEGEDWVTGREQQVIEIPPQQIIVAFSHGTNQSTRRIPPTDQKPSCFWHFPQEYLVFIHGLVGVEVVTKSKA
jgi:glycosyltransferase involved in cell wall biosynthesis